jgi:uncharacterized membrane protein YgcG
MTRQLHELRKIGHLIIIGILLIAVLNIGHARAQQPASSTPLSTAQVEQLVAPIALYPDELLSQILMASTYPLEVVSAARWSQANPTVTGEALKTAMAKQPWDPSVKALTALPQTLHMMNDKLDWTQQLGDAFLAQQQDVLDAVQRLRARADANGQLKSSPEQTVTIKPRGGSQTASASVPSNVYVIEPTNPDEYYVPIYDPGVVYGAWPYSDYQPFYWYPPGYAYGGRAFSFAAGVLVGSAIWGNVDWFGNRVGVNPLRYNNFNRTNITNANWNHNPAHRGATPYRDAGVAQRFGDQSRQGARENFRSQADAGRRNLGNQSAASKIGQPKAGNLGQQKGNLGQQKGKAGQKAADRTAGGNRTAGGSNKAAAKNAAANKNRPNSKAAANKNKGNTKAAANNRPAGNRQAQRPAPPRQAARPSAGSGSVGMGGGARSAGGPRGGGGGRGGGGRRSDVRLKHDITLLGYLDNGIGFYRFSYNGSSKPYVGVLAQDVQQVMPQAVTRGRDGYLRVFYDRLGLTFQTYREWIVSGARVPTGAGAEN